MESVVEQRVVMVNLVQCFCCRTVLAPGQEQRRVMVTAVEEGSRLRDTRTIKAPVSLCGPCDRAAAEAEKIESERSWSNTCWGWSILGGVLLMSVFTSGGLSFRSALIATLVLFSLRVVGYTLLALFVVVNTAHSLLGFNQNDAFAIGSVVAPILPVASKVLRLAGHRCRRIRGSLSCSERRVANL